VARTEDVPELATLSRAVYGPRGSWKTPELFLHQEVFPEGQLVAEEVEGAGSGTGLLGMAVSLVLDSGRWPPRTPWRDVTDRGRLTTHDPSGDLLYGAGLAVHPEARGQGVARALYAAREALVERLEIHVIRAGARIPGFGAVAHLMTPEQYVEEVVEGIQRDPTLSFQLRMGFHVVDVAPDYLVTDEASRRWAAIIEWRRPPEHS
jgi:GNAT superfamily N-acetyltransferase